MLQPATKFSGLFKFARASIQSIFVGFIGRVPPLASTWSFAASQDMFTRTFAQGTSGSIQSVFASSGSEIIVALA